MENTTTKKADYHDTEFFMQRNLNLNDYLESHIKENFKKSFFPHLDATHNPLTGNVYKGFTAINTNILREVRGFEHGGMIPSRMVNKLAGWVKSGERAIRIFNHVERKYFDEGANDITEEVRAKKDANEPIDKEYFTESKPLHYAVFSVNQINNLSDEFYQKKRENWAKHDDVITEIDKLTKQLQVSVNHSDKAKSIHYNEGNDTIFIPAPDSFQEKFEYIDKILPMIAESLNHPERLNRKLDPITSSKDHLGSKLADELTAGAIAQELGYYKTITDDVALIKEWQRVLKADPYFLHNTAKLMKGSLAYVNQVVEKRQVKLKEESAMSVEKSMALLEQDSQKKTMKRKTVKANGRK